MRIASPRFFLICVAIAVAVSVLSVSLYAFIAHASVYNLYASTCLGGWGNTHLSAGTPQAVESNGASVFTEANSARLDGSVHAQIYCGGFSGDILENTVPKKILVKFSWAIEYPKLDIETPQINQESATSTEITEDGSPEIESLEAGGDDQLDSSTQEQTAEPETIQPGESPVAPEVPETVESVPEPAPEEPTASILNFFAAVAHAQELSDTESSTTTDLLSETATTTTDIATTTLDTATTTKEMLPYGLVEVLYTLNGVEWKSLGFVKKDEFGSKYFEIPIEEASKWEDVSKIQIGIQSVPVVDGIAPTIYLDAVWLEVEYQKPWEDPYVPPGGKEDDTILSEVRYEDMTAVLVSRKPELLIGSPTLELWLSYENVAETEQKETLAETTKSFPEINSATSSTSAHEDATASTTDLLSDAGLGTSSPSEATLAGATTLPTGLYSPKQWRFIADGDQLSDDAHVAFLNGNIFWFGKENLTVWRFNPQTGAYDSASFNPGESLEFHFRSEASELLLLKADSTGVLNSEDVPIKKENEE